MSYTVQYNSINFLQQELEIPDTSINMARARGKDIDLLPMVQ
jgi:hypothetical protein